MFSLLYNNVRFLTRYTVARVVIEKLLVCCLESITVCTHVPCVSYTIIVSTQGFGWDLFGAKGVP